MPRFVVLCHDSWLGGTDCVSTYISVESLLDMFLMDAIEAIEALLSNSHTCFGGKLHLVAVVYMFQSYL